MASMNGSLRGLAGAAAIALMAAAAPAHAAGFFRAAHSVRGPASASQDLATNLVVGFASIQSRDSQGEPGNTILSVNALPGGLVDSISWNLSLTTNGASWLS